MTYTDYDISAEFYDHVVPYRDRHEDVQFYVDRCVAAGPPVLELGCGTGRVLLPIARAGIAVTGVDRSAAMLSVCRERLAAEPAEVRDRVRLVEADMRFFDLQQVCSLVIIPFRAFQHLLTVEDQRACLDGIRRHLKPGGELIFDLFNPSLQVLLDEANFSEWGDEPEFTTPSGRRVLRRFRTVRRDLLHQIQHLEMIYHVTEPDGSSRRHVETFSMRHLFRYEVEHLLARSGFVDVQIFSDFNGTPYGTEYPGELVIHARRAS